MMREMPKATSVHWVFSTQTTQKVGYNGFGKREGFAEFSESSFRIIQEA